MTKWFYKLPRLVQCILIIIPVVGWIVELIVRWGTFIEKGGVLNLLVALLYTFVGWGLVLEILDVIWVLLFNKLFLTF